MDFLKFLQGQLGDQGTGLLAISSATYLAFRNLRSRVRFWVDMGLIAVFVAFFAYFLSR